MTYQDFQRSGTFANSILHVVEVEVEQSVYKRFCYKLYDMSRSVQKSNVYQSFTPQGLEWIRVYFLNVFFIRIE